MPYYANEIRKHAFATVHEFDQYPDFEAAMVAFGDSLPPIESPTAKDPHYHGSCRSTAKWAWDRKATIVPYADFVKGKRIER